MVGLPTTTWVAAVFIFMAVALGTISVSLLIEYFLPNTAEVEEYAGLFAAATAALDRIEHAET